MFILVYLCMKDAKERMMNNLRRQENGQMAILMVLVLPVVFLLFTLPLDAGSGTWTTEWPKTR